MNNICLKYHPLPEKGTAITIQQGYDGPGVAHLSLADCVEEQGFKSQCLSYKPKFFYDVTLLLTNHDPFLNLSEISSRQIF